MKSIDASEATRRDEAAETGPEAIRRSLGTVLAWRRAPAVLVEAETEEPLADNLGEPEAVSPTLAASSHAFDYGNLSLALVTRAHGGAAQVEEIPSSVIDSVLRMIVDAHFAVWYVWHVTTGACSGHGLEELLGLPAEAVPTFIEEWLGFVHPDDLPRLVAENDAAIHGDPALRSEYRLRSADGTYLWVRDWAVVLRGSDGEATWMAGGVRDITTERSLEETRREVNQLYDALFSEAPMPTFLVDLHGKLLDANQAALDFLETNRELLMGKPAAAVLSVELAEEIEAAIGAASRLEPPRAPRETQLEVSGAEKWLFATVVPFETQTGPRAFVLGADVTEQKRMIVALAESEKSLHQKTKALKERNVALRVLIEQKREDTNELVLSVTNNIEQLVMPSLNLLEEAMRNQPEIALVEAARLTLAEIAQPLIRPLGQPQDTARYLSRREYEVLQFVRTGKTTDEIAGVLSLSPATVAFHRNNIRRKLGLHGTGRRLAPEVRVDGVPRRSEGGPARREV